MAFFVGIYPRLLGADWNDLDETVQRLHVGGAPVHATGSFRIRHGTSVWARWLLRLLRMPPAGDAVPTRLVIAQCGDGEKWLRNFGGRPFVTTQSAADTRLLAERYGALELTFRLRVDDHALVYRQAGVALRVGRLSVPLPSSIAPVVAAREEASGLPDWAHVTVQVRVPFVGLLILYDGTIATEEAP